MEVELGKLLQMRRRALGWSAAQAGELYGIYSRGKPVTEGSIFMLEEGKIPKSVKRRWVLAQMYGIAPATLGLSLLKPLSTMPPVTGRKVKAVDGAEFQDRLMQFWKKGYDGQPQAALKELGVRIYALHDTILYVSPTQRDFMKRLLCAYHLRRAEVARELGHDRGALDHLNKAILLSHEEGYADMEVVARYRRGEFYIDRLDMKRTLHDFNHAYALMQQPTIGVPDQVKGRVMSVRGLALAMAAETEAEMCQALHTLDASEQFLGETALDTLHMLDHTLSDYLKHRTKAFVMAANNKLHRPQEAFDMLEQMKHHSDTSSERFHAYIELNSSIVQSLAYADQGYFPISCTLALDAVEQMKRVHTTIHVPTLTKIYRRLQASSYGNAIEVAELGLRLLFLQFPQLAYL